MFNEKLKTDYYFRVVPRMFSMLYHISVASASNATSIEEQKQILDSAFLHKSEKTYDQFFRMSQRIFNNLKNIHAYDGLKELEYDIYLVFKYALLVFIHTLAHIVSDDALSTSDKKHLLKIIKSETKQLEYFSQYFAKKPRQKRINRLRVYPTFRPNLEDKKPCMHFSLSVRAPWLDKPKRNNFRIDVAFGDNKNHFNLDLDKELLRYINRNRFLIKKVIPSRIDTTIEIKSGQKKNNLRFSSKKLEEKNVSQMLSNYRWYFYELNS